MLWMIASVPASGLTLVADGKELILKVRPAEYGPKPSASRVRTRQ